MKKEDFVKSMDFFAETIHKLALSDRDINIGVGGFTGEGKTLQEGETVLMFDGCFKKVENVKVGDQLMGVDSTPRNVLRLHNGYGQLYKIHQNKGESYVINDEHILSLKRTRTNKFRYDGGRKTKRKRNRKGEILNISIKDYLNLSNAQKHFWKGYKVSVDFPEKELLIDPYFIGLWLGDGTSTKPEITSMDLEIMFYMYDLSKIFNLKLSYYTKLNPDGKLSKALSLRLTNKQGKNNILLDLLRHYNLVKNKHIPSVFKINCRKHRLSLLAGILDSDGYVNRSGYVFVNKNERLINDVLFLGRSLGFQCYKTSFINKQYNLQYFKVGINGDCSVIPVKIKHKKVLPRKQIKDVLVTGINVEPVGLGQFYGFALDGDNLFILKDFTVTHNSCFLTKLFQVYSRYSSVKWGFNNMTWSRKELLKWIDGDKKGKGGQLPEYSSILIDELFMLFYKRNWYDEGQIDAIGTLNMCRDRHLLIGGNIPNFWDLDTAFTSRIRFYIYIPYRGVAWVFEQENNPFSNDVWNRSKNEKGFRKFKTPYFLPNFLCEIHFNDWSPKEKRDYYKVRNSKRLMALDVNKAEKIERYRDIKKQRDDLIRLLLNTNKKLKNKDLSDLLGISGEAVRLIREGLR